MKVKYEAWVDRSMVQSYVTTTKPQDEMVAILVEKYFIRSGVLRIIKVENGKREQIYTSISDKMIQRRRAAIEKPISNKIYNRPCVNMVTGQEYKSIRQLASELCIYRSELTKLLENPPHDFIYALKEKMDAGV